MMKQSFFFVLLAVLAVPMLLQAKTVESDNFVLRDSSGNMTAQLTTSEEGTPAFFLYDKAQVPRVSIGLYADGAPGVVLNDDQGRAGAIMRLVNSNGEPVVVLKENGQDRYVIRKDGPNAGSAATSGATPLIAVVSAVSSIFGVLVGLSVGKAMRG